jgi:hypothetical protein
VRVEVIGLVGKEVASTPLRCNVALADIRSVDGGKTLGVTGGRERPVEIDVGARTDEIA